VALLVAMSCVPNAPVVQGKVLSVDTGGKVIAVQDEARPDGAPILIDISQAEIGAPPVPGDQVRLAYRVEGSNNIALRVMNLTQEKGRGKRT
jgi:hypothetical protein